MTPFCRCGHSESLHLHGVIRAPWTCKGEVVKFKPLRHGPCPCRKFRRGKMAAHS